ncbi:MAG: TldD/PmbA family protein [Bacilli bacterium]|nr:TldD/PmbA family protein [Bacilli bacterium]
MNVKKFFELAKEKGLSDCQIQISKSKSTDIGIFRKEIDSYTISDSQSIKACGIYNGKFASCTTNRLDKNAFEFLINGIIDAATVSEKEESVDLFEGSEKYHKKNVFNPALAEFPIEKKIELLFQIEKDILASDPRVSEVETVSYRETESSSAFYSSKGLKLSQKRNLFTLVAGAVGKQGEETKTAYNFFYGNDFSKVDEKKFVKELIDELLPQFGGTQCKAAKYPTVLRYDIFSSFVGYFIASASADEVQRHTSFLGDKLHQKVASKKITISERPLDKNPFFTYFDDEGVATYNKDIVKGGVLETFLYNRETAKKDGVSTTGNGYWAGSKIGTDTGFIKVKQGKKSFEEMIAPIKEGVYITDIAGLGTGMNSTTGNFSCQASGYMIRDGKVAEPLNLITLSGNLLKMFADVKDIDKQDAIQSSINCPDVFIKKMSIGGK